MGTSCGNAHGRTSHRHRWQETTAFSWPTGWKSSHLHGSAWATENQLVLGQTKVADKSNEITAIPELLRLLDISGCIVTIDAIGTQTEITETIIEGGGDYLLAVKENQAGWDNDYLLTILSS